MSPSTNAAIHITEPHPSVPSSHALFSGRGGAGNVVYANPKNTTPAQTASGPASRAKLTTRSGAGTSSPYYLTGRGGAGNAFSNRERERAMFCFDEELEQQARLRENAAPIYHVGRGGAGNAVHVPSSPYSQNAAGAADSRDNASTTSGESSAAEEDAAPASRRSAGARKASVASVASSEASGRGRGRRSIEDAWSRMVRPFSRH